jgi:hypothetical protein
MTGPEVRDEIIRRIQAAGVAASDRALELYDLAEQLNDLAAYCAAPPTEDDLTQGDRESLATVQAAALALRDAVAAPADALRVALDTYAFWKPGPGGMRIEGFPHDG